MPRNRKGIVVFIYIRSTVPGFRSSDGYVHSLKIIGGRGNSLCVEFELDDQSSTLTSIHLTICNTGAERLFRNCVSTHPSGCARPRELPLAFERVELRSWAKSRDKGNDAVSNESIMSLRGHGFSSYPYLNLNLILEPLELRDTADPSHRSGAFLFFTYRFIRVG